MRTHPSLVAKRLVALAPAIVTALLVAASLPVLAQQGGSLADVARQARAQKQAQPKAEPSQAQQVADELSEEQDDVNAPAGFKTYNAAAYKALVPAPYTAGHDDGGILLSGPAVGGTRSLVLLGNPLVHHAEGDDAFRDAATQSARVYAQTATCTKTTLANHSAYKCGLSGANLGGQPVTGTAVFLLGSGNILPVFCVATTDSRARDILNNPYSTSRQKMYARQTVAQQDEQLKGVWQKCDTVFQSIRLKEDSGVREGTAQLSQAVMDSRSASVRLASQQVSSEPASAARSAASAPTSSDGAAPVAAVGHESAQPATPAAAAPANTPTNNAAPAGPKVQSFTYCKSHNECWNASVSIPAEAQLVSSNCGQYVFQIKVQGEPFLLLAGPSGMDGCPGRAANDPSLIRWKELVDPETARAPGTASTISSLQAKLEGKPAIITTLGFRKSLVEWIGKRAEVESNGVPLVVGCMAQRDHFYDGDAICSALIESLRLP